MNLIHVFQDTYQCHVFVYTVVNLLVPLNAKNFLKTRGTISFLSRTVLYGVSN